MNAQQLLTHFDRIADAPDAIPRLRRFILDLAVRGKLVPQDPNDEPASELLRRIKAEKARLVKTGKISVRKIRARNREFSAEFVSPSGWVLSNLGEIATKITDGTHKTPTYIREGVPFVSVKDFSTGSLDLTHTRFISKEEHDVLYKRCNPKRGDILLGRIGTLGKAVLVQTDIEFSLFVSVGLIRFDHRYISPKYFLLLLNSPFVETEFDRIKIGGGTHTNKLNLGDLHTVALPIPPLADQHRIVAKVDSLMTLCDRLEAARAEREANRDRLAKASLARLNAPDPDPATFQHDVAFALNNLTRLTTRPDQIKALRQTILNLAVRGKLVPQDPNDEPASKLLKRIAVEKTRLVKAGEISKPKTPPQINCSYSLFETPPGWAWVHLSEISRKIHYGYTASANQQIDDVRLLRITDIHHNKVAWRSVPGCEIHEKALPSFKLEIGDILIARTGGTIGKSFLVVELPSVAVFASYLIRVQVSHEVYARYLKLFLESPIYWTQLREGARGAGQPNVNGQTLGKVLVSLPPLVEQHRVVAKVDELMVLCDWLETSLTTKKDIHRRLRDALLRKAQERDGNRRELER